MINLGICNKIAKKKKNVNLYKADAIVGYIIVYLIFQNFIFNHEVGKNLLFKH